MTIRQVDLAAEARGRRAWVPSLAWALVPLLTLGWGTGASFAYAAIRLRSRSLAWFAAAYVFGCILSFQLVDVSSSTDDWRGNAGAVLAIFLMTIGSVNAFTLRGRLLASSGMDFSTSIAGAGQEQAIAAARARISRRIQARRIVSSDPVLARELGIGRPELRSRFDDGGLVDVNHATASSLASVPGISADLAGRIIQSCQVVGGYADLTDLSVTMGIAPPALDESKEFLVFLRLPAA